VVGPGTVLPPTWDAGDPVPPGIVVVPGTTFPSDWTPEDPVPEGVTLDPGAEFPPGWNPPDPVPEGLYPAPALPPDAVATGPTPPTYVAPGTPGPVHPPSPAPAAVCEHIYGIENFTAVTPGRISDDLTHVPFTADLETWSVYLIGGLSGSNHLQIAAGYISMYQSVTLRHQYVYLPDSDALAIRCATNIRVQNKRRSGGGVAEVRLYDAQPPGGNVLFSEAMRTSGSYGFTDLLITSDITGYTDLYLCLYVYNNRWQEITRVIITEA